MQHGPDAPMAQSVEHMLGHVEGEAVSTRWCVVCTCGWRSGYRARAFLWTHFTAHLELDLEDREGRLAVMYAVAAAVAGIEGELDASRLSRAGRA
jgi:hypothetical protein